ncbi:MAG: Ig domain-containing protein, partial [Acidobacteriota bacterium]
EKRSAVPAGDAAGVASPNVLAAMPVPDALAATFAGPKPQAPLTMDRSGAQGLLAGGPINVLLAMADDGTGEPLRSQILAYADIGTVDVFDTRSATPTLPQLQAYHVVVVWTNYTVYDRTALGDVLADYVDGGGRVILAVFSCDSSWGIAGRIMTEGYAPFLLGGTGYSTHSLGAFNASHPIMSGVTAASDFYWTVTTLDPGATLVASWSDGAPFVATKGCVVGINSYPGVYYLHSGDVPLVFHNAVSYLYGSAGCCDEAVADGGFEGGTPNASWTEASTNFGTPLCDGSSCGNGGGTAGPHAGAWWAWFGGTSAEEAGSVEQTVTLQPGTATLTFWAWYGNPGSPADYTRALVDGTEVWRANGDSTAYASYTQVAVDIGAYADGGSHTLRIESYKAAGPTYNFNVDDVSIQNCTGGGCPTITIDPAVLPPIQRGTPWSVTFTASGGTEPYSFSLTGTVPPGLIWDQVAATLSGTPTWAGDYEFTIDVMDANECTGSQTYTVYSEPLYTLNFYDNLMRGQLCVDAVTGHYVWTNFMPWYGTYEGQGVSANGGTAFWTLPEDPTYIYATYDSRRKRARAYLTNQTDGVYSAIVDSNTTNNPACGEGGPQG